MSFDGFFLHHMVEELRSELVNGRIQKINQPFEQELVLQIRSNRQSHRLLLSAHPVFGRIQLTQTTFENPAQPSTFIMVLRKYLQGAVIESIEQIENDRIVEITVSNKNEIGDHIQATLIIEIMGKHSNILLVDKSSHKILEVINMLASHKIATAPYCQAQAISLRQVPSLSILLLSRMKSSLKSCKPKN